MNEKIISGLSRKTGLSKSTVSKAVNHCGGVSVKARQAVLSNEECDMAIEHSVTDCYLMTPDSPLKFWGKLRQNLILSELYCCKYNVFTNLHDDFSVNKYFIEADNLKSRLIIAAADGFSLNDNTRTIIDRTPVFFLSEFSNDVNAFYFGANSFDDGKTLGKIFLKLSGTPVIVRSAQKNSNAELRVCGFLQGSSVKNEFLSVQFPDAYSAVFSAKLAASLSALSKEKHIILYCPYGKAEETALAVLKAGLEDKTEILCHDLCPDDRDPWLKGRVHFTASVNQDVESQARAVARAAETYLSAQLFPDCKYNYFPSRLCIFD